MGTTIFSPAEFTVVRVVSSALILGILVTCRRKVSGAEIASQVKATNRREHPQSFIHDAAKRGELCLGSRIDGTLSLTLPCTLEKGDLGMS